MRWNDIWNICGTEHSALVSINFLFFMALSSSGYLCGSTGTTVRRTRLCHKDRWVGIDNQPASKSQRLTPWSGEKIYIKSVLHKIFKHGLLFIYTWIFFRKISVILFSPGLGYPNSTQQDEKEGEQDGARVNKKVRYQSGHMWYQVKLLPGLIGQSSERP